jgi:PPOX class probable F420-dependent enzyme
LHDTSPANERRKAMVELDERTRAALDGVYFWTLATVNPDGTPQSTVVWVTARDGRILVNSRIGHKKPRNVARNPSVSLSWYDPEQPYGAIQIQGRVVDTYTGDQAEADIDALAKKYLGEDVYPWRSEGERRISFLIEPTYVQS